MWFRISNAIIQKLKLDSEKLAGELSDKNIEDIENAIANVNDFVPKWLLNRQKDYDTGEDMHPVSIDLKMLHEDDINRMKRLNLTKALDMRLDTKYVVRELIQTVAEDSP